MEKLFLEHYTASFGLPVATTSSFVLTTDEVYFEVEDDDNRELVLHTTANAGEARFSNPDQLILHIVNYDKFLTSLSQTFQHGKGRCDLILCSDLNDCFILGELKDRVPNTKVRKRAKGQLLATLSVILAVPEITILVSGKTMKRCCYFNRQPVAPQILNAVAAFNSFNTVYKDGLLMSNPDIEALGFDFYEYAGEQTLQL